MLVHPNDISVPPCIGSQADGLTPVVYNDNGQFPEEGAPNPSAGLVPIQYASNGAFPEVFIRR